MGTYKEFHEREKAAWLGKRVRYNVIIDGEWYMAGSFEEASTCAARWEADEEPHSVMIVRSEDDE